MIKIIKDIKLRTVMNVPQSEKEQTREQQFAINFM